MGQVNSPISVVEHGKLKIIMVTEKVNWDQAKELDQLISDLITEGATHIVFNLERVKFLCSAAIGVIACYLKRVREMGGDIYLVTCNEYVDYVLGSVGFEMLFKGTLFKNKADFGKFLEVNAK